MPWPSISDYQEAIQNPRVSLSDPELQQGAPVCNRLGLPVPITGGFASVYQLRCGGRTWAIRCFLRQFADQQKRYREIDRHLGSAEKFSHKVGFQYQPRGIRIRGEWYPVLKMEWVSGSLLNEHVESLVQKGDATGLRKLADDWLALLRAMKKARIAHGDLQHGNVLVAGGKLLLIDYDGMYVPGLAGIGSHEAGHPSYQHPRRGPQDYGPEMDRFAALAIHVAILALACEPSLWPRFNNGDNLLFRRNDFLQPADSPVFDALQQLQDREIVRRAILLQVAGVGPIAQVPEVAALPLAARRSPLAAEQGSGQPLCVGAAVRLSSEQRAASSEQPFSASRLPEWVAEQLLSQPARLPMPPAPAKGFVFAYRLAWKRPDAKASGLTLPGWLQWLPVPSVSEQGHSRGVNGVAFVLQGAGLATGSDDGHAFLWAPETGRRLAIFGPHTERVAAIAAVGSSLVATASGDQCVRLWNRWGILKKVLRVEGSTRIYSIAGSADGTLVAAGLGQKQVRLWNAQTGAELLSLRGHTRKVRSVAFFPGGERLVSGSADMSVRVWDVKRGTGHLVLYGHSDEVTCVSVSPNGQWIASGGRDGTLFLWDARTGQPLLKIPAKSAVVAAIAFAPDSSYLLSAGSDPVIRCWDLTRGQEIGRLEGHSRAVRGLAVAADGRRIASCGADGRVLVWAL
jgi:hypothetical protein